MNVVYSKCIMYSTVSYFNVIILQWLAIEIIDIQYTRIIKCYFFNEPRKLRYTVKKK